MHTRDIFSYDSGNYLSGTAPFYPMIYLLWGLSYGLFSFSPETGWVEFVDRFNLLEDKNKRNDMVKGTV